MKKHVFCLPLLCIIFSLFLGSCNTEKKFVCFSTVCEFEVTGSRRKQKIKQVYNMFNSIENVFSTSNPDSEVSLLNASCNQAIHISNDFINLFEISKEIYDITNNFNPAIFPIVELWSFSPSLYIGPINVPSIPNQQEIESVLPYCNMNSFLLDKENRTITKTTEYAKIDFGSIAKGYACDLAFDKLKGNERVVVNVGGTIKSSDNITVHVKNSNLTPNYPFSAKINLLPGQAIATSGDYERFYLYEGNRYHHLFSSDGYPAWIGVDEVDKMRSVSIIGNDATICDALSTLVFVEGITENTTKLLNLYQCSALIIFTRAHSLFGNLDYSILDDSYKIVRE